MDKHTPKIVFSDEAKERCRNKFFLKKTLQSEENLIHVLSFSSNEIELFYQEARSLLDSKNYSDAGNAFLFLTILDQRRVEFWVGLGIASQLSLDFDSAIDAYEIAATCELENPIPYLYLAKVFFALHEKELALEAIAQVLLFSADKGQYSAIAEEALRAKEYLQADST